MAALFSLGARRCPSAVRRMWGERRSTGVWRSGRDFICLEENGAWLRVLHPVRQHASFPCPELTKHAYFTQASPYQAILARDISILFSIVFIFNAFASKTHKLLTLIFYVL